MKNAIKVITIVTIVFVLTALVITYQREVIVSHGAGIENDIFYTILVLSIIFALDAFVVLDCIYMGHDIQNTDSMTGIPNMDWITRKGGVMDHFGKLKGRYTLMFINIKDCKYINEKIGNFNGDKLIRSYAQKLKTFVKRKGYVGRMGGDNFLIIVKNEYVEDMLTFLKDISIQSLDKNNREITMKVEARGGICKAQEGLIYREMINRCSTALALAKEGADNYVFFDEKMMDDFVKNKKVLDKFRLALDKGEFQPYYQPKVRIKNKTLCGAEALARWIVNGKIVSPMEFIPALEADGAIKVLDYYIFEQVCKQQKEWIEAGIEPVCISVNFSKLHLDNPQFAKELVAIKDKCGVDARYLEIELTESTGCEDYNLLEGFAKEIKAAGFRISIDDFGTGYSSLSMLQKFEADSVKLDKSFLNSATSENASERNKCIMNDIIGMIKRQGEESVCEGVETEDQVNFVREAGCDTIQGFYYDRPMPKADFEKRLIDKKY